MGSAAEGEVFGSVWHYALWVFHILSLQIHVFEMLVTDICRACLVYDMRSDQELSGQGCQYVHTDVKPS